MAPEREDPDLLALLGEAQRQGFVGPGPLAEHVEHALGFCRILAHEHRRRIVDLGSGGGLPGLVIARHLREAELLLVDSNLRRTGFLETAVDRLGLEGRVEVLRERAETAGQHRPWRAGFDAAVARGFGRPAVTAECAAAFLRVGGLLVVSEPPTGEEGAGRWPEEPLRQLGLVPRRRELGRYSYQTLEQVSLCPARYPRRSGVPAKRPLF